MSNAFAPRGTELQRGTPLTSPTYTTIAEVTKISISGSKADLADVTNMDSPSNFREFLPTLLDSGEIKAEMNFIPGDATQAAVLADFNGQVLSPWQIVLPNSLGSFTFNAYVTTEDVDLPIDKQGTRSFTLKVTGPVTFTAG
jgi:predicted secreted protein